MIKMEKTWALIFLLLLSATAYGLELNLNLNVPVSPGSRSICGVLHCVEDFQASDESSISIRNVSRMTIYKTNRASAGHKDSKTKDVLVASLTPQKPKVSRMLNGIKVDGLLNTQWASLRLTMYAAGDCSSEFLCKIHGANSKGDQLVMTSRLLQGEGKRQRDDPSLASEVTLQVLDLVQRLDTKVALVTRSTEELGHKMETFENRFEDKLESINEHVIEKLASLENRIEDKIEHNIDDKLNELKFKMFELTKNVDFHGKEIREIFKENLLVLGQELKLEQNEALANMSLSSQNLHSGVENITSSSLSLIASNLNQIKSVVESDRNVLDILVEAVDEISQSSESYSNTTNTRFDSIEQGLRLKFHQLTSVINSSAGEVISSTQDIYQPSLFNTSQIEEVIRDIFTPKSCLRGMNSFLGGTPHSSTIYPSEGSLLDVPYICDSKTLGGGWYIIQRRINGDVDFYRDWAEYRNGFGSLDGDFWLGNENIHAISNIGGCELRVELIYNGRKTYAQYSTFSVADETNKYTLRVGGYSGTAGDSLDYHNGQKFSTFDEDNDVTSSTNCAQARHAAWWFKSCDTSSLNGIWMENSEKGVIWDDQSSSNSLSYSEMKMRC